MTYKQYLEQLLREAAQKSDAYLKTSSGLNTRSARSSGSSSEELKTKRSEWETAERTYADFLILIKSNQINPDDVMTDEPSLASAGT